MSLLEDASVQRVHCIGVGGIGVSALAEMLLKRGFKVSGSDVNESERLAYLRELGAKVFVGHRKEQVAKADLVVYSSAIDVQNPELSAAKASGVHMIKRGHLLAELMQFYRSVAIAGTHGKTTTTAMTAHILCHAGIDPTYFIGGIPQNQQSPVNLGKGDICVAEADESDASFLHMHPEVAVVTNIERDHMTTYADNEAKLLESFLQFLQHVPKTGKAIMCLDDINVKNLMSQLECGVVTYGCDAVADFSIQNFKQVGLCSETIIKTPEGNKQLKLQVPGLYNVKNALAAMLTAVHFSVTFDCAIEALATFKGVGRRFQSHGDVKIGEHNISIYEDYGHHPTEFREAYLAAKNAFPDRRVIMILQPHRFSRTEQLWDDFLCVLADIDHLVLLPTFAASEAPIVSATSEALARKLAEQNKQVDVVAIEALHDYLENTTQANDVLLFQGAGSVGQLARQMADG